MANCLSCHRPLGKQSGGYHAACAMRLFGSKVVPELAYATADLERVAAEWMATHATLTGVQPKLSLHWQGKDGPPRLTIVGALEGQYILKAPYAKYPHMPELEALCMNMALACGMPTVPFGLIALQDGALCYITRRIDRDGDRKVAMEDFCQLSERLTEDKYKGSHEQVAKLIQAHSKQPLLDLVRYFEQVLFSFLIGNSDMHLKNFSLHAPTAGNHQLAPAYDLVSSQLLVPEDQEDLALTLNGRKRKLDRNDFDAAMNGVIPGKARDNLFARIQEGMGQWPALIAGSFIPENMRARLNELIANKAQRVGMTFDH